MTNSGTDFSPPVPLFPVERQSGRSDQRGFIAESRVGDAALARRSRHGPSAGLLPNLVEVGLELQADMTPDDDRVRVQDRNQVGDAAPDPAAGFVDGVERQRVTPARRANDGRVIQMGQVILYQIADHRLRAAVPAFDYAALQRGAGGFDG